LTGRVLHKKWWWRKPIILLPYKNNRELTGKMSKLGRLFGRTLDSESLKWGLEKDFKKHVPKITLNFSKKNREYFRSIREEFHSNL
jgi:hypothetical protein